MTLLTYPFTEEDSQSAHNEWGANCGPNALAFAMQVPISEVRTIIPGFEEKRYTSPSMMMAALKNAGLQWRSLVATPPHYDAMFQDRIALTRIQWTGPWTAAGANPKWAYRQTHWIATWLESEPWVFDCNGGIVGFDYWQARIASAISASIPRADGGWYPTHVWQIQPTANGG